MAFTEARNFKIPNGSGGFDVYPVMDARNRRVRKNITNNLTNLPTAIAEQNLQKYGYDIGDYFFGSSGYEYTLGDEDPFHGRYYGNQDDDYKALTYSVVTDHHLGIIVNTKQNVEWNPKVNNTDSTATGYNGSSLHTYLVNTVLPKVKSDIAALFGNWDSHLIKHQKLLTTNNSTGWGWQVDQYISALTSVQIHGAAICDINWYQSGEACKPLEVFQKYKYNDILGNRNVWLRSIASASCPCDAGNRGYASGSGGASGAGGCVGLILFK